MQTTAGMVRHTLLVVVETDAELALFADVLLLLFGRLVGLAVQVPLDAAPAALEALHLLDDGECLGDLSLRAELLGLDELLVDHVVVRLHLSLLVHDANVPGV